MIHVYVNSKMNQSVFIICKCSVLEIIWSFQRIKIFFLLKAKMVIFLYLMFIHMQ